MYGFNPSDLASDNLDAANADWEDYAAYLDAEDTVRPLHLNDYYEQEYALDDEFGDTEDGYYFGDEKHDLDYLEEAAEYDDPLSYDDQWGADEYGF